MLNPHPLLEIKNELSIYFTKILTASEYITDNTNLYHKIKNTFDGINNNEIYSENRFISG